MTGALPRSAVVGVCVVFALAGGYVRRLLDLFQAAQGNVTSAVMSAQPLMELGSNCEYAGIPCKYVWGHRLLVPYTLRWTQAFTGLPYEVVFYAFYLGTLAAGYLVFYWYLRHWLDEMSSVLGVAYLAAVYPLTQTNPDPAQMMVGLVLYALAVVLIEQHRIAVLALVMFLGVFNREEIGGVLILYALRWGGLMPARTYVRNCLMLFGAFGLAFWGTRYLRGIPATYVAAWTVGNVSTNLRGLLDAVRNPTPFHHFRIVFYLAVPLLAVPLVTRQWRAVPPLFRRTALFAPLYVGVLFFFSILNETKQFMPMMVVLIPLALTALCPPRSAAAGPR